MNIPVDSQVLYIGGYPAHLEAQLRADFAVVDMPPEAALSADLQFTDQIKVATGIARVGFSDQRMAAFPTLRAICLFGAGHDGIDLSAARRRGIAVTTTPGVTTDAVADLAIGLLLAVVRSIAAGDRYVRSGAWESGRHLFSAGLTNKRIGIVGLGQIGLAVAQRAQAFKMEVAYFGRRQKPVAFPFYDRLAALARDVDYLIVTAAGGPETRHLINRDILAALGRDGVVINVARGSIVDESALIEALEDGVVAGAGLDVFEREPHVPEALRRLDSVVLTPHCGGREWSAMSRCYELVRSNIGAVLAGRVPPNAIASPADGSRT